MLVRFISLFAVFSAALLVTSPARADWHKAESERFVIFSDSSERDIREFAERLERYHVAMTKVSTLNPPTPSPSNRVTVYAVGSPRTLKRLYGDKNSSVGGFYIPRAAGSVAFVPNVRVRGRDTDDSMIVLLHEYAHHFTIASSSFALPRWVSEGSAEFFASVKFAKDGGLDIGLPANHRAGDLNYAKQLSLRQILDYDNIAGRSGLRRDGFYGQAWLLYHYLMFNEQRLPQYGAYMTKFMQGMPSLQAAEEAFGDLDQLQKELKAYQRQSRIPAIRLKPEVLPIGDVTVTKLTDGMDAMMDVILKSRRGVSREEALELLPDARKVAAKFPNDPGVLAALAEAEYDAGNDAEAIAAADKAIAIDPSQKNAYVQKGYALFRIASAAEPGEVDDAYDAAMKPFEALNAIENDHPLPLMYYFRSFVQRGKAPSENARAALERASVLAPFDRSLRFNVAMLMISEAKNSLARQMLAPLAADPHQREGAARARELMAVLERTPDGTRIERPAPPAPVATPEVSEDGAGEE
ncbi:MAG: hypothetical protein AAF687_06635 [Pseudomonadota bacterium]